MTYDAIPLGPPQPGGYGSNFVLPELVSTGPPTVPSGAKIFTDIKKANKFMRDRIIIDVDITQYETSQHEGLIITVFFEVGEADETVQDA